MPPPHPSLRARIETLFAAWGRVIEVRRWWVVGIVLALSGAAMSQLSGLGVDTSTEGMLRPDNPARRAYTEFRAQFGRDQRIMIAVEPPEIFDVVFMRRLRAFHQDLEDSVPMIDDITSMVNARSTYGRDAALVVEDLLEEIPETPAEMEALRERVMSSPSYVDRLISADGTLTLVVMETDAYSSIGIETDALAGFEGDAVSPPTRERSFLTGEEEAEIVAAVREVVARHQRPDFRLRIGGNVLFPLELQEAMGAEMPRFMSASLVMIALLLGVLFRRVVAVVLPLFVVVLSLLATLSSMAIAGMDVKLTTQILPSFLLAVGIGYTVHLLNAFFQRVDAGAARGDAVSGALEHAGLPILMTALTTIVGVLSFTTAELAPAAEFGITSAAGVAMALIYSLSLLPALLCIVPARPRGTGGAAGESRFLSACGSLATRHPRSVSAGVALVALGSMLVIPGLQFSANPLEFLPETHPVRVTTDVLDERMGGSVGFEVLLESDRSDAFQEPELLNRMAAIEARIEQYVEEGESLGRVSSILDVARETHQALNENRTEFYAIAQDPQLLAQELLLFENSGSDDLERLVDSQFSRARMTVRADFIEPLDRADFLDRARREFAEIVGSLARVRVTGIMDVMSYTGRATVSSMVRSYLLAFVLITPLMIALIGNLRAGLVSMVPNLVPIALTLALMVILGIELDLFTLLIGCIIVGLAVDDTIHFIHSYRRELARGGDPVQAIHRTLQTTGRALLYTSIILCCGFVVFVLSSMHSLSEFGLLVSFALAAAFLLDVVATPALLLLLARRRA